MRHIIDAIASQGRGGDSELLHVSKGEMAGLDALARRHFGRELPRNPRTGLKEASLFRDWFGNDVGMALDVAAPVAVGMIPGVGIPAAVAMGAATGAANQGLGKGGTTESALMGGVMGGIGAYGGSGLAEGLGAGATTTAPAEIVTPTSQAGASLGSGTIADAAPVMGNTTTAGAYGPAAGSDMVGAGGTNLFQGTGNATTPNVMGNTAAANTFQPGTTPVQMGIAGESAPLNVSNAPLTSQSTTTVDKPLNWNYLKSKDALGNATAIGTSALGTAGIPGAPADTTPTTTSINRPMPKAEVYYTPTGERRTRIVAAEGGLMSFNDYDAADAEKDGGYAPGGIAGYDFGGMVKSIQPGGAWGDATANLYGAVDQSAPWLKDITPGGAVGQLQPGRRDWEEKKRQEEEAKANDEKARVAAEEKAKQQQAFQDQWSQRYGVTSAASGGIMSAAQGRYLQGPGDGMSDSIKANIDGRQEARLATGEFVVPADVVSHLGNGDSNAGAKQLHSMMDRARMSRTGTKKQGKQINPRKVMPT